MCSALVSHLRQFLSLRFGWLCQTSHNANTQIENIQPETPFLYSLRCFVTDITTDCGYGKDLMPTEWKLTTPHLCNHDHYMYTVALEWHGMAPRARALAGRYGRAWDCIPVVIRHVSVGERGPQQLAHVPVKRRFIATREFAFGRKGLNFHLKFRKYSFEKKNCLKLTLLNPFNVWFSLIQYRHSKLVWFSLHQFLDYSVNVYTRCGLGITLNSLARCRRTLTRTASLNGVRDRVRMSKSDLNTNISKNVIWGAECSQHRTRFGEMTGGIGLGDAVIIVKIVK